MYANFFFNCINEIILIYNSLLASTEFSSIYGVETQKNVIKILVDVIIDSSNQSSISDDQLFETIKTVRILCREPIGQEFYTSDVCLSFIYYSLNSKLFYFIYSSLNHYANSLGSLLLIQI